MNVYGKLKGRGSGQNESSRFHSLHHVADISDFGWVDDEDLPSVKTEFFPDQAKTILSTNSSPDIGFNYSLNAYRGCEHGCSYCYARPTHEYLGLSAGLDFETKIFYKKEAAKLLRQHLMSKSWQPQTIMMSGVTDCYQPAERVFKLTRGCLEVLAEFKNPTSIITKNKLICRDLDILSEMAKQDLISVAMSITSLDADLARKLEPRTSTPLARLQAVELLAQSGIPVFVNIAPVIPGLNDHEIPQILKAAADAGADSAGFQVLRLPYSVKDIFTAWLGDHVPLKKDKVISAIFDVREGKLNESDFSSRMKGTGKRAEHLASSFRIFKRKYFPMAKHRQLRTDLFKRPSDQMGFNIDL